jgi:hypothetical protein
MMNRSKSAKTVGASLSSLLVLGLLMATSAHGAVAIDASVSKDNGSASKTASTPAMSTTMGNELLLAFVAADYLGGTNTTVTSVTGGGLTWVLVVRSNAKSGDFEIWRTFAPSVLSNVAVTATLSQSVVSSITVMSFTGVDTTGTNGSGAIGASKNASAASGAPTVTLVTTRNNSWVFGGGNDFDNAIARTVGTNQSLVHQYLTPTGDTYWVQMQNNPTAVSGTSVAINDAAPTTDMYNVAAVEVLPATGVVTTYTLSGTISPAVSGGPSGAGAVVTLSGASSGTATADSSGNYSFSGLANGSYTVTPNKTGYTFTPSSQTVSISGANLPGTNFTIQAIPTYTISGTISPAVSGGPSGAGAVVTLSGASSGTATADSSGNYSFSGLANGSYTLTPNMAGLTFAPPSQTVSISGANDPTVNFTDQTAPPPTSLALDVKISADSGSPINSVASPMFSTVAGNELLLAFVAGDYLGGTNTTVTNMSGGGLTWVMVVRSNAQDGDFEVWRAFAPSTLTNVSVTAMLSQSVVSSITVMSFTGVDTTGTNGSGAIGASKNASAVSGAPTVTLVTTRNNSWVFGGGNDFDNAIPRTVGTNQSLVHQYLTPTGDTYWVQMQNNPTAASATSVSINDTAPTGDRFNVAAVEVLPMASGGGATPPSVSLTTPSPNSTVSGKTTVAASASDPKYAITGVQFLLDGSALGTEVTTAPYTITWDTSTATAGPHTLAATVFSASGLSATSTAINVTVDNSGIPAIAGSWSTPVTIPTVAVNLILLKNNTVMFYQDGVSPTVWDYINNVFTNVSTTADLFCSGHGMLKDGRVLAVGGFGGNAFGIANAEIFDPTNNTWTAVPNMAYRRWYPTATTLSDGRVIVMAGWQTTSHTNAGIPEIYDPSTNAWTQLTSANNPFETYPFIYLLPDGRLLHIGGSEYATVTEALNLTSQTWTTIDSRIIDGGSSTMYFPNKILKAGSATDSQETGASSNTAFVLDMTQSSPAWQPTGSMKYARSFLNLTTLPDGTVLATGGESDKNGGNISNAVYAAELWSPQMQAWTVMASMHTPREYHSTALLLPDGRVMQSGMGADFGNVPNEMSAEFYSPPYLFKGPRPTISQSPTQITYGSNFFVGTPDAATITSAVLIRTGAVTHFFDQSTYFVPVSFTQTTGGLTVTTPANGNQAPPGYYMLFLVNNNGVPSVAPFVQLN